MKSIARFFILNSKFTLVVTGFFILIGITGLMKINSESYPSVNFAMATITTIYPGATSDDIEARITIPLEEEIRKVSGLKDVRSVSRAGRSEVLVRVDMDNENEVEVLADLEKAIDRVSKFPADLRDPPVFNEINSQEFPAIELALTGPNQNGERDRLAKMLKDDLEDSSSVLEVRLVNYSDPEFQVEIDQAKLDFYHLSVMDIFQAIGVRNFSSPGGDLESDYSRSLIRVDGKTKTVQSIEDTLIRSNFTGEKIFVKDVAKVSFDYQDRLIRSRYNNEEATLAVVTKKAGADTIELVSEVESKLQRYNRDGFKTQVYLNEAQKVKNRLEVLSSNALSGLVLVIIFLLIFLPGRVGIMASLSLPIAVMGTIGFMPSLGMNLDMITILALIISLGMLVDNSVVISENFTRLREEGIASLEAAIESVRSLWFPITATAMTTIAAFLPMLVTKGIMGQFIKWIPIVVSLSLILSLAESFFLLPMRIHLVGGKVQKSKKKKGWFERFQNRFEGFMHWCVSHRYIVSLFFMGCIALSIVMLSVFNTFILFPAEQTEIYIGRVEMPANYRVEQTMSVGEDLIKKVQKTLGDDLAHITFRGGTSVSSPNDPKGETDENMGLLILYMTREASFRLNYKEVLERLRKIQYPKAQRLSFEELVNGPPVGEPINATLRSSSHSELESLSLKLKDKLSQTEGIFDVKDDFYRGTQEVRLVFDYPKMSRLGLDVQGVANSVKTGFQGQVATYIVLEDKEVGINVKFQAEDKLSLNNLGEIKVADMRGNLIPLKSFTKLEKGEGAPILKRFDYQRSKTITASIKPPITGSGEANKILLSYFKDLQKEYPMVNIVFGGEAENTAESMQSLAQAGMLAVIFIYAILVLVFNSFLRPAVIISTIPLGLVGFSIAFYLHQRPVSFLALIGIIGLAGIIVNSGIVLISFIDELRKKSTESLYTILAKASGMRLKAVIVTSLTTISGLLPTAYGIGGYEATLIPMTLAMAWGLMSGTILTLVWVPCGYAIVEDLGTLTSRIRARLK